MTVADRRTALVLIICLWVSVVSAQLIPDQRKLLTTADGLPNSHITGMVQDKAGFLWISTADGLARYDGYSVKTFLHQPGNPNSLADNIIRQLEETASGQLLISTESGTFQLFNPVTERFTRLLDAAFLDSKNAAVSQCHLSADGLHAWGLLPGVRLIDYDVRQKTVKIYDATAFAEEANTLHDFILTRTGYLYTMRRQALVQLNTKTGKKRIIPFPNRQPLDGLSAVDGHELVECPDGQIALVNDRFLTLYDPVHDRFRTIPIPEPELVDGVTYTIKMLSDNRLYLGYMDRLYQLDASQKLVLIPASSGILLRDRSGVLWARVRQGGLQRYDLNNSPFSFHPIKKSFAEDLLTQHLGVSVPPQFEVWSTAHWPRFAMGPNGKGYLFDPSNVYQYVPGQRAPTEVSSLHAIEGKVCCKLCLRLSRSGNIWFYNNDIGLVEAGPDGALPYLHPNSRLPLKGPNPGYDAGDIQPIGGSVWVGSQLGLGLFQYDIKQKRYVRSFLTNPDNANSLPANTINCLTTDPLDSTVLWIGTAGGGLCRLATRTMTFRRLGEAEGFPNDIVQSMETDKQGFLWCATSRGLVRLNPETLTWRHFTTADGLADTEFARTSSAVLPTGKLVFGTLTGQVVVDPQAILTDTYDPPLVLTALRINNVPSDAHMPGSPLTAPINALSELQLDHTQNFLTVTFAGLHYAKTDKIQYRYQLVGVDEKWVNSGTQQVANYTQLGPGTYQLIVNCTRADGQWSQYMKRLQIRIRPPFWATWWAYGIYALALAGMVWGYVRFRVGQNEQKQEIIRKRLEAEQLKVVDEVKSRFFSNITHEFRTPLSLILLPVEKLLQEEKHDTVTRRTLTAIENNAQQLLRLINQLLDLSKLDGHSMRVSLAQGDGVAFIQSCVDLFRPVAEVKRINLQLETNGLTGDWLFDTDKWEKIITNLLSNALKFTPVGGQITVTIQLPELTMLVVQVADTGIGIMSSNLPHVFDRFYQVDDSRTRAYEGTGIGLALVKELTSLLGGTISVESRTETPSGTTFTLGLPVAPVPETADALPASKPSLTLTSSSADSLPAPVRDASPETVPLLVIVEDNEELRTFIASELGSLYRVITAGDGEEGWQLIQDELPDVVISDVMMPRMDGYQLTHCIKSTEATNHIAVILLTAKSAHQSLIKGLQQGADDYLTKPFHMDELYLRLRNLLNHQQVLKVQYNSQLTAAETVFQPSAIDNDFLKKVYASIEARLDDSSLTVDELAGAQHMSRRTLHRKLTALTNLSANELIRQYRLRRATELLRNGHSVAETAYRVGFDNPAYFSTLFKQTYQQTPTDFVAR